LPQPGGGRSSWDITVAGSVCVGEEVSVGVGEDGEVEVREVNRRVQDGEAVHLVEENVKTRRQAPARALGVEVNVGLRDRREEDPRPEDQTRATEKQRDGTGARNVRRKEAEQTR
jgi:hypothetical protein